jgi:hypothetical protein
MWLDKFKANLCLVWQHASAQFIAAFSLWEAVPEATKAQLFAVLPPLPPSVAKYAPAVLLIVGYLVTKGWPQPDLAAKLDAKKAGEAQG